MIYLSVPLINRRIYGTEYKQYGSGETAVKALDNVDLSIEKGKIYVILGPSGSGKSTLMNMLGGIDTLTSGSITVDGRNIYSANKKELTQ